MLWSKIIWKFKTRHFLNFIQITGFLIQGNYDFTLSTFQRRTYIWVVVRLWLSCINNIWDVYLYDNFGCFEMLTSYMTWRCFCFLVIWYMWMFFSESIWAHSTRHIYWKFCVHFWDMNKMSANRFDMCFWRPSIFLIDHPTHTGSCLSAVFIWFQAHVYLPIHTSTWRNLIPSQH